MRKTLFALLPAGAVTLMAAMAIPSGPAQACGLNSYIGSVCYTAGAWCPAGMQQLYMPNATLPISQYQVLGAVIGTLYGGDGRSTIGLPNLSGRTLVGAGQGPGLSYVQMARTRGTPAQALAYSQMPAHTHDATLGIAFTGGAPTVTWQAATAGAAANIPSTANSTVAGISPAANMWSATLSNPVTVQGVSAAVSGGFTSGTVTNTPVGNAQAFDIRPPRLVVLACMPIDSGTYPYPPRP